MILGIDPSLRHTGLCLLLSGGEALFHEIKTEGDVLTSTLKLEDDLKTWIGPNASGIEAFAVERRLHGGSMSSLLYHVQMTVLRAIGEVRHSPTLVLPLPIQLIAYMKKRRLCAQPFGRKLVKFFQEKENYKHRISEHCVDAFYTAQLAKDVLAGEWEYPLPKKELTLTPWRILNGSEREFRQTEGLAIEA